MLELRPNCELCDCDLPPTSERARICTYECTFCVDCAEGGLRGVCPNCGGDLVPRPIRPMGEWRPGTGLTHHPAGSKRRHMRWTQAERAALSEKLEELPPERR